MSTTALVIRLAATTMSFGGPVVDQIHPTDDFPGRSMITGLLANALGYERVDGRKLAALQARVRHAARADLPGRRLMDYQTVDLGQPGMDKGWTTHGAMEGREGGNDVKKGTHIKQMHYITDAVYTVAIALADGDGPDIDALAEALTRPARPLCIGRKACVPSRRLLVDVADGDDVADVIARAPRDARAVAGPLRAWWPRVGGEAGGARVVYVPDQRDWTVGLAGGRRAYCTGMVDPPAAVKGRMP